MKDFLVKNLCIECVSYDEFKDTQERTFSELISYKYPDCDNNLYLREIKFLEDKILLILEWRDL